MILKGFSDEQIQSNNVLMDTPFSNQVLGSFVFMIFEYFKSFMFKFHKVILVSTKTLSKCCDVSISKSTRKGLLSSQSNNYVYQLMFIYESCHDK